MKRKLFSLFIFFLLVANLRAQDTPYLGEIKICSFNFAPWGWAFCEGQLLSINQNQALYSLLGTTFGGNGQTNFALPDLRGRMVIGTGAGYVVGQMAGEVNHTLIPTEMPSHTHILNATTSPATTDKPAIRPGQSTSLTMLAAPTDIVFPQVTKNVKTYATPSYEKLLSPQTSGTVGGAQPHNNLMPYVTVRYIIALQGIFPDQN